ncbi:hypothetical protein HLH44_09320 [Gluconacetobacter sp. 1c LMG 22058]|uniref:Glycosyltransferase family 1 protein n=1 Tax=Gluconacetobacter dulcium TaxID=2729096 RepID=A0A7W4JZR0_9PROT|nr:hypothetical protein [Gluconacetobacter dulcium]MBB2197655.1 hypothetical protein [Gluconacetobacter dulcium]
MKYIVLIPHGSRTGGPEALYQLADALAHFEQDVSIWLYQHEDLNKILAFSHEGFIPPGTIFNVADRHQDFPEYQNYKATYCNFVDFSKNTCFIFPEVICHWSILFSQFRSIIWWLSVDNGFSVLGKLNINFLRQKNIFHLYQSEYAGKFLEIMNLSEKYRLSDYTPIEKEEISKNTKKDIISINSGKRNIFDISEIGNNLEKKLGIPVVKIRDMKRDDVYSTLKRSFVYIDLSRFPGKDRMPREAIIRGAGVVLLKSGAFLDFFIPDEFIVEMNQINHLDLLVRNIVINFSELHSRLSSACNVIFSEKTQFFCDVFRIISLMDND